MVSERSLRIDNRSPSAVQLCINKKEIPTGAADHVQTLRLLRLSCPLVPTSSPNDTENHRMMWRHFRYGSKGLACDETSSARVTADLRGVILVGNAQFWASMCAVDPDMSSWRRSPLISSKPVYRYLSGLVPPSASGNRAEWHGGVFTETNEDRTENSIDRWHRVWPAQSAKKRRSRRAE